MLSTACPSVRAECLNEEGADLTALHTTTRGNPQHDDPGMNAGSPRRRQ